MSDAISMRRRRYMSAAGTNVETRGNGRCGGKTTTFNAPGGLSLYDAAENVGVSLPACCWQGSCSACAALVLKGKVSTKGQTCIPPGLAKEGYVAMCCGVPLTDVTLKTHQGPKVRAWRSAEKAAQYAK
ncbi:ferredoxin [Micractinium conductrix]|uniref:Ferredoxin n=1 Tax=Micractinium conductrix TaxID=554055 RepID=A0A2P6V829_9CHLO|nr:ferredoxin [Micractinium conductrix]|eukprot:PSC70240.1 ferredoxin [Micractinium conductrix]